MTAKYYSQIPPEAVAGLSAELREAVGAAVADHAERKEKRERSEAVCAAVDYAGLFAAFDKVTFEPPTKKGRFTYDDKKFFTSLKKQALSGKALSEKQTAALRRMAMKYHGELTDAALVDRILEVQAAPAGEGGETAAPAAPAAPNPEVTRLLEELGKVTEWAEPVKKGRFTYDDKVFYESLAKQHASGKILSERQQAALIKMAGKYGVK